MEEHPQQNSFRPTPSKNWLVESILVTIFCCLLFGIAGIVNVSQANSRYAAGEYEGAEGASGEAGEWTKIAFLSALAFLPYISPALFGYSTFKTEGF